MTKLKKGKIKVEFQINPQSWQTGYRNPHKDYYNDQGKVYEFLENNLSTNNDSQIKDGVVAIMRPNLYQDGQHAMNLGLRKRAHRAIESNEEVELQS